MPETPEQRARRKIDADLTAAGWLVRSQEDLDLTAGRGIAVREFQMKPGFGFADYLLYLDRRAAGAIEAKPDGTLTGVEAQSAKYAAGLPENLPAHRRPLPSVRVQWSRDVLHQRARSSAASRQVFNFPRPETLADSLSQATQLRALLMELPTLDETGLWSVRRAPSGTWNSPSRQAGRPDPDGDGLGQDLRCRQYRLSIAEVRRSPPHPVHG
jgi:type I restriction enzyme R subunit